METVLSPKLLEATERRMRFCGTCGIALGLMTGEEFDKLYACLFCGEKIHPAPEKEKKSLFPPEIEQYLTPTMFFNTLREVFAEREKEKVHLRLFGC